MDSREILRRRLPLTPQLKYLARFGQWLCWAFLAFFVVYLALGFAGGWPTIYVMAAVLPVLMVVFGLRAVILSSLHRSASPKQ